MDTHFDVALLGTGLVEAIAAAALAKAGLRVVHIDTNPYYGADDASLTLDELAAWADARVPSPATRNATSDPSPPPAPHLQAQRRRFTHISRSHDLPPQSRQFAASLSPSVVPAGGRLIDALIASGVSRYGGFKLLERVALYADGLARVVPGNKEDVFKSKDMSLIEKRRLMKFLMFAAGTEEDAFAASAELAGREDLPFGAFLTHVFQLDGEIAQAVVFALAYCPSAQEPALPALRRIHRYLRSAGRYGSSPFLLGHYGSSGEIAQGFCRICAVAGGTYILGRPLLALTRVEKPLSSEDVSKSDAEPRPVYSIELEDVPDVLTADMLIASPDYLPPDMAPNASNEETLARCVAVIDRPITFTSTAAPHPEPSPASHDDDTESLPASTSTPDPEPDVLDTGILVFPPSSLPGGSTTHAATVLVTGDGSLATPAGKWLVYIALPLPTPSPDSTESAETLLRPYLDATLALRASGEALSPLFTLFYAQTLPSPPSVLSSLAPQSTILTPHPTSLLPEAADAAAVHAERVFWDAVRYLRSLPGGDAEARLGDVDAFWPPREAGEDEGMDGEE